MNLFESGNGKMPRITVVKDWADLERAAASHHGGESALDAGKFRAVLTVMEGMLDAADGIEDITFRCISREDAAFIGISVHDIELFGRIGLASFLRAFRELGGGVFRFEIYDDYRNGVMGPESEGHVAELLLLPESLLLWSKHANLKSKILEDLNVV